MIKVYAFWEFFGLSELLSQAPGYWNFGELSDLLSQTK
jgi:hypothetical protein